MTYVAAAGSSPLARGKPSEDSAVVVGAGLIPARAGKTTAYCAASGLKPAHPRSRGENRSSGGRSVRRRGSSPLARGKHAQDAWGLHQGRLIPARAGKTSTISLDLASTQAHPRSRGENLAAAHAVTASAGSSPLARGKLTPSPFLICPDRLIPARAGKTVLGRLKTSPFWAHPRSRGENAAHAIRSGSWSGSSPLARGKLLTSELGVRLSRLIPARAGKTLSAPG